MDLPVAQNVRDHLYDPLSNLWIGYVTDGDDPSTTMFDPASQAKMAGARKAFPDQHVTLESWSTDFNTLIVFTSGGDDSGTDWLVDLKAGKAKPLGADYPAVKAANVGPSRMFDWKAADGLPLRGVLTSATGRRSEGPTGCGDAARWSRSPRLHGLRLVGSGIRRARLCSLSAQLPGIKRLWPGVS